MFLLPIFLQNLNFLFTTKHTFYGMIRPKLHPLIRPKSAGSVHLVTVTMDVRGSAVKMSLDIYRFS
jgi:hypothetical protein